MEEKQLADLNKKTILTSEGLQKLEQELENLKTIRRKEVAEKIKVALSFGDLSENSEYDEAKNEQAMIESRIAQLDAMLKNVKLVDKNQLDTSVVQVGSKVKVENQKDHSQMVYAIVGSTESSPAEGKISDESPVGKALLEHAVGDTVEIEIPAGCMQLKILEITK